MRPPARPPRDTRLDILRGWMQVSIFISHAAGTGFAWLIHASWGISDSSEQFVLLSGLSLGSVFALKRARDGFATAARDLARRVARLWRTHLLVFVLFAMMVLGADALLLPGVAMDQGWGFLAAKPWLALPGAAAMLYQPEFMGILPVFVWCMLLLPGFLWLVERVGDRALLAPFGLYAATQLLGLAPTGLGGTEIAFDPFAWQALFLTGAWLGRRALYGVALPRSRWLVAGAAALLLGGVAVKYGMLPDPLTAKDTLAPLRFAHALALAYLVAVLVPREAGWMRHAVPQALAAIGRHSLQVFCLGLFLSWGIVAGFQLFPAQHVALDLLLVPLGAVLLWGFARRLERPRAAQAAYRVAAAPSP